MVDVYTLREIGGKNVISTEKGIIIGTVDDLVFDEKNARVKALLIYGRPRLFGLMGRDADVRIPWEDILTFGQDVIMVKTQVPETPPKQEKWGMFRIE